MFILEGKDNIKTLISATSLAIEGLESAITNTLKSPSILVTEGEVDGMKMQISSSIKGAVANNGEHPLEHSKCQ